MEARGQLQRTPLPSCSSGTGLFSAPHNVLRLRGNSEGTITEPVASLEIGGGLRTLRAVPWDRFPELPEFLSNSLGALKFPWHRGLSRTKYCSHYTKVVKALASGPQRPCVFPGTGGGQAPHTFLPHWVSWTALVRRSSGELAPPLLCGRGHPACPFCFSPSPSPGKAGPPQDPRGPRPPLHTLRHPTCHWSTVPSLVL